jgi:flagellar biosynthesis protein FliR
VFELNVSVTWALSLALATARTGAFVAACALVPRSMPRIVRGGFALALALLIATPMPNLKIDTTDIVVYVAVNAFIGFVLGWLVGLLTYVFDIAGSIIDFMAGTTAGSVFSHETGSSEGPVARFTSLAGHALLISLGGLTLVAQVLAASTTAIALDGQIGLSSVLGSIASARSTSLLRTGVELALPVGAVLFTLELGFGVLSRFVPQLNAFLVGLPVKLFTLFLVLGGFTVTFPAYADNVLAGAVTTARDVLGALTR